MQKQPVLNQGFVVGRSVLQNDFPKKVKNRGDYKKVNIIKNQWLIYGEACEQDDKEETKESLDKEQSF